MSTYTNTPYFLGLFFKHTLKNTYTKLDMMKGYLMNTLKKTKLDRDMGLRSPPHMTSSSSSYSNWTFWQSTLELIFESNHLQRLEISNNHLTGVASQATSLLNSINWTSLLSVKITSKFNVTITNRNPKVQFHHYPKVLLTNWFWFSRWGRRKRFEEQKEFTRY